jgi:16S rRNA (guanine527-N7)-methyltransferase
VFNDTLIAAAASLGISLEEQQRQQFKQFASMLVETNKVMNLTAITDFDEIAVKHMADSLSCYAETWFPQGATLLDLGTGAGFPGIPLLILRPDLHVTFFDSLQKRLRFLQEVTTQLGLTNVAFLHGRAEDMAHTEQYREAFHIVTSRAVARLPVLAEWALPYVEPGGVFISLKGALYEEELDEAKKALSILGGAVEEVRPVKLWKLQDKRAVLYIRKTMSSPKKYPRKPNVAAKNPL